MLANAIHTKLPNTRTVSGALTADELRRHLATIAEIADAVAGRIQRDGTLRPLHERWERTPLKQLVGAATVRHLSPDQSLRLQLDLIAGLESLRTPIELRRRAAPRR